MVGVVVGRAIQRWNKTLGDIEACGGISLCGDKDQILED